MRRAARLLLVSLGISIPCGLALAGTVERASDLIDGAGMLNYMQRPTFTVGTWVKYRTLGSSEQGLKDDYTVTILAAGEEVWWGEPCFWVETRTKKGGNERVTASLVSYAAFGDSMADRHILWFIRKTINGVLAEGRPDEVLYTRDRAELQQRKASWEHEENPERTDSLGLDTATVAAGKFYGYRVRKYYGISTTAEQGDSTVYYERRLNRTFHISQQVPFSNLAQVELDDLQSGKTWLAGKFDKGPLKTLERARGNTELIAYGTSGLEAVLVPEASRHPIDRKLVDQTLDAYMQTTPKVKTKATR